MGIILFCTLMILCFLIIDIIVLKAVDKKTKDMEQEEYIKKYIKNYKDKE